MSQTPPRLRRFCSALCSDHFVSPRVRLAIAVCAAAGLSYALLAPDPWWIIRWLQGDTARVLQHGVSDKLHHVLGYLTLTLCLMWWAVSQSQRTVMLLGLATACHAVATELLQHFVPGRTVDRGDFVANLTGVSLGVCAAVLIRRGQQPTHEVPGMARDAQQTIPSPTRAAMQATQRQPVEALTMAKPPGRNMTTNDAPVTVGDAPAGLSRNSLTSDELAEIRPRMINFRFVAILATACGVFFSSVYAIHGWQMRRNAGSLIELGERAREAGDVGKARDYLNRYVGMVPGDANALATLGVLLDDSSADHGTLRRVFAIYEDVLRSDPTREDIRRRQIETAMAIGRYSDALAHVKILRQVYSTDGDLAMQAGLCQHELGDFEAAAESYAQAIEFSPRLINAWARLADLRSSVLDDPEGAVELLDRLVDQNSSDAAAWLVRAKFLQRIGDLNTAADDMQEALSRASDNADLLLAAVELGYARIAEARSRGQFPKADRLLHESRRQIRRAIELAPDRLDLQLQSILAESHFGDEQRALEELTSLLNLNPGEARAHLLLADLTIEQGDFDKATEALDLLPRTPASDAMRLFLDGRIAMAKKQWQTALSQFKEARRFQADMPDMLERTDLAIAACYRELGDTPAEISSLRQIVKYHPKSVPGRLALAAALLRQQDLAGAIVEYRPLASLPHVRLLLARLLILQNLQMPEVAREWREAETLLNDATQQHSDPTQIVLLRAELLAAKGQFATAQRLLKDARTSQADRLEFLVALARLAKQAGDEHRAALWMGQALASAGNSAEAEVQLRQAIELAPQDTAAARTLMELYVATDRRDAAVDLFRKYAPKMSTTELAQTYALFGDHARAAALFERESAQDQTDLSSLDGLASVYLQNQMLPEAEATLERLVRDADATSIVGQSARRRLALLLSRRNDHQSRVRALQLLDDNVAASEQPAPDDLRVRAAVLASASLAEERDQTVELLESLDDQNQLLPQDRWLLGRLYQAAGRADEASHQLERSIASGEVSERLLADYAEHLVEHADEELARHWVTRLRSQYPEAADSLRLETRLAVRYGDSQQAVSLLKSFVTEARDDASRTSRLIKAAAVASDINLNGNGNEALDTAASEFLTEAVQLDPKQIGQLVIWQLNHDRDVEAFEHVDDVWQQLKPDAAAGLSLAMLSAGPTHVRAARVEKQLTAALRKNPGELLVKVCLADVLSLQERYAEAESLYRQVLHVDPQSLPPLNNLAWLLGMQNRATDEALSLIERGIEAAGPAPQLLDTRACILISQGRTRQASTDLKKSIADGGTTPTTLLHLAAAQLDDGDTESARQTFEQAKAAGLSEPLLHPLDRALLHRVTNSLRTEQPAASNDV